MYWLQALILPALLAVVIPPVAAAPLNYTIDDQDFGNITYSRTVDWLHDPLIGWESHFFNGSRSYTYVPGASASFTFTGFGIYLQGPSAPDQARRRVFIDGQDMGAYDWIAADRTPSAPFYSKTDLTYTTHTVVIAHNDTANRILALDAWIIVYDPAQTPLPYTTTTLTQTAPATTITRSSTDTNGFGSPNGTVAGNPDNSIQNSPKSYSTIIIGIVVPIVVLLFCICIFCLARKRRTRSAQRRRESFREKFTRRQQPIALTSPLTPAFGERVEGGALAGAAAGAAAAAAAGGSWGRRSSDEARAHIIASTRYLTAHEHIDDEYELDQGITQDGLSPTRNIPVDILDPPAAASLGIAAAAAKNNNRSQSSLVGNGNGATRPSATFDPPAEWRTTLSPHPGPGFEPSASTSLSNDAHVHQSHALASGTGAAVGVGRLPRTSHSGTDAYPTNGNITPKPSTVYSESDSSHSVGGPPPSRFYQHQPLDANLHDRDGGGLFGVPAPVINNNNTRSNSVLRRFSTAIASTLPFTRPGSRPTSRHSNSYTLNNTTPGGGNNDSAVPGGHAMSQNDEDLENNGNSRGYFRGVNHFNLGIPLNYRPTATATPSSNTNYGPTTPSAPAPRNSQNLGFNDIWLGTGAGGGGGGGGGLSNGNNGNGRSTASAATTPGISSNLLGTSPFDDGFAFSSYTRQTRERVMSYPSAGEQGDNAGDTKDGANPPSDVSGAAAAAAVAAAARRTPATTEYDSTEGGGGGGGGGVIEPEEKDEKIKETLDGDTMRGEGDEGDDQSRWSVGHRTLASQDGGAHGIGGSSSIGHGGQGLARQPSGASRQRSIRSTADQGRQVIPPPYSVYIPPDTKTSHPPPGS